MLTCQCIQHPARQLGGAMRPVLGQPVQLLLEAGRHYHPLHPAARNARARELAGGRRAGCACARASLALPLPSARTPSRFVLGASGPCPRPLQRPRVAPGAGQRALGLAQGPSQRVQVGCGTGHPSTSIFTHIMHKSGTRMQQGAESSLYWGAYGAHVSGMRGTVSMLRMSPGATQAESTLSQFRVTCTLMHALPGQCGSTAQHSTEQNRTSQDWINWSTGRVQTSRPAAGQPLRRQQQRAPGSRGAATQASHHSPKRPSASQPEQAEHCAALAKRRTAASQPAAHLGAGVGKAEEERVDRKAPRPVLHIERAAAADE